MGRVRACSAGRYPRFTPAPIRQPRPSVAQRSGKRRHLRQQVPEMLSVSLLLGKRRIPPVARLHREAGGAQGARSIRIAQGTVNKLGGGALRGSARVRAALLHSGRPGSLAHRRAQQQICLHQPAAYRLPTHGGERAGTARGGGDRGDGRRLEERGAARRGPRRPTIQQHHCAPHRVLAHTHRLAPYRARGAAPISPTSVNWPFPPSGKGGAD